MPDNFLKDPFSREIDANTCGRIAQQAWLEDGALDITSQAIGMDFHISAGIFCREKCVLAGIKELKSIFGNQFFKVIIFFDDGADIAEHSRVATVVGPAAEIFKRIRTCLNIISVLSGITTETKKYHKIVGSKITALRKTHPFVSLLEKRAVTLAGGKSHRLSLSDGYMIKSFYIDCISREKKISIESAIHMCVASCKEHRIENRLNFPIEVEARNETEAVTATMAGADVVMLDNFAPDDAKRVARRLKSIRKEVFVEVSGGITLKNIWAYDCDFIDAFSTSEITLKARPIDFYFRID